MSKYLFIGAHTDDAELSCGGTMAKLVEQGHLVNSLALSYCDHDELIAEFTAASAILGVGICYEGFDVRCFDQQSLFIADALLEYNKYDFVFTHSNKCRHPDHRTTAQESKRIYNCNLITYIQPWNGSHTDNFFIELSEQHLEKKIEALKCYKSQAHRSYMDPDFIRSWARYNGIKCGKRYAEAFRIERYIQ